MMHKTLLGRGADRIEAPSLGGRAEAAERPGDLPWRVLQHNADSKSIYQHGGKDHTYKGKPVYSYKPVYIVNRDGERVLFVGENDTCLPLAKRIVGAINVRAYLPEVTEPIATPEARKEKA